jgi:DNA-binding transcriptional LysR family regulator
VARRDSSNEFDEWRTMHGVHARDIDLNLLVVFDAVFAERSVTAASAKLHLTQPAVSHALTRLRRHFDDPLFRREQRTMVPTAKARSLIGPVRTALRELDVAFSGLAEFDVARAERRFAVGLRDVLESTALPAVMRTLMAAAPGVAVDSVRVDRRALEAELAAGRVDAAIDVALPLSSAVKRQRLERERLVVVLRRGHPRARRLTLARYAALDHLVVSSRRFGMAAGELDLIRLGVQRRVRLRCQHYFAACRVVAETDLALTMPERYARIVNDGLGTQIVALPFATSDVDIYLYWHASVDADPANVWLRGLLRGALGG